MIVIIIIEINDSNNNTYFSGFIENEIKEQQEFFEKYFNMIELYDLHHLI